MDTKLVLSKTYKTKMYIAYLTVNLDINIIKKEKR